ncbi:MAG: hypothetical protein GXP55_26555, partial [Deltaproteobacteria bacterium]|nr:hypothetical protein [Deltaproteobacteria bacterium]
ATTTSIPQVRASFRKRAALVLLALFSLAADCGFHSGDKGLYEPCTRDYACRAPLICRAGACAEVSSADAAIGEASVLDADAPRDAASGD